MKVEIISFRKPSVNLPKKKRNLRKKWLKKKRNKNWHSLKPKENRCSNLKRREKRTCLLVSLKKKRKSSNQPFRTELKPPQAKGLMMSSS